MKINVLFTTFLLFFAVQGVVQAEGVSKEIKFKSGHSSAAEKGCVVGADTDEYTLEARRGQTMSVSIESEEDNAVFNIFYWSDGVLEPVEGTGDQEEGSAVKHWKGKLPGNADETTQYKIEVGKERGNACYTLKVGIK